MNQCGALIGAPTSGYQILYNTQEKEMNDKSKRSHHSPPSNQGLICRRCLPRALGSDFNKIQVCLPPIYTTTENSSRDYSLLDRGDEVYRVLCEAALEGIKMSTSKRVYICPHSSLKTTETLHERKIVEHPHERIEGKSNC